MEAPLFDACDGGMSDDDGHVDDWRCTYCAEMASVAETGHGVVAVDRTLCAKVT